MPLSTFIFHSSSLKRSAFTLTELMISVALALLLLVGINQVFKTTSQTVGTSYATLEGMRKQLALDGAFTPDIDKAVGNTEQPFILIHSESVTQYWDANDANSDPDGKVETVDLDGDGKYLALGENASPADLNSGRVHRLDRLAFFARDVSNPFHRQTADATKIITDDPLGYRLDSDETSSEAFIWYGFLRQPSNGSNLSPLSKPNGDYFTPDQIDTVTLQPYTAQQNVNNFYVKDFALGRQVILLKSLPTGDHIDIDVNSALPTKPAIPPISADSPAYASSPSIVAINNSVTAKPWLMAHSRFDIAKTTIADFRKTMAAIDSIEPDAANPGILNRTTWHISDPNLTTPPVNSHGNLDFQFNGKPWADPQGDRTAELSTTVPFLVRGCSQFIVEWAGDYLTQDNNLTNPDGTINNNYGNITGIGPDGILDYFVKIDSNTRRIPLTRWYGFPRNVDTSDDSLTLPMILGINTAAGGPTTPMNLIDVVPLRDVLAAAMSTTPKVTRDNINPDYCYEDPVKYGYTMFPGKNYPGKKCPERYVPPIYSNYADPVNGLLPNSKTGPIDDLANGKPVYVAAWGPSALTLPDSPPAGTYPGPWLIRVILNVRDPNGRLPDGQTVEHVYTFKK